MSDIVIKIENLYKEYRLGVIGHGTLYRDLQTWWAGLRGKEDPNSMIGSEDNEVAKEHVLALNCINLEIESGEVVGIIGKNGAGKSTLLKVLSQITAPTKGLVKLKGRCASLLEVGTGFHGELTGRENIYLNGSINGMDKREVSKKLDEIVDFAGVGKFLDTPVKRYSSGMFVRLGFAVAAHLEPDILIVDEVLAVGDYEFQKKCIGKMGDVASQGRTILFVSHNLGSVQDLCSRTILLEQGRKIREGKTAEVISYYVGNASKRRSEIILHRSPTSASRKKSDRSEEIVRLNAIRLLNDSGDVCDIFTVRDSIYIQIECDVFIDMGFLDIQVFLENRRNETIFFSYDDQNKCSLDERRRKRGRYISTCKIPGDFLNDGRHSVIVKVVDSKKTYFQEEACSFDVDDSKDPEGARGLWTMGTRGRWPEAVVRPKLEWDVKYSAF
jgi:lipopolysaccharide transport system ATP-binding protein